MSASQIGKKINEFLIKGNETTYYVNTNETMSLD